MEVDLISLKIVLILTVGFAFAAIFGYLSQRAKFSPILGYLIAGYLIGPFSPGFVADKVISEQLSEIGVILMMFGVGLNFKFQDLWKVGHIAVIGAIVQTTFATLAGAALITFLGWPLEVGLVFGFSIGVASTVVLVRAMSDNNLMQTPQGHICVSWLVVEDIITVFILLILPTLALTVNGEGASWADVGFSFISILIKFFLLGVFLFTLGRKAITYVLSRIKQTDSHELFIVGILALTFAIATGSAIFFGTSIVLGAFIAGMVIGQTHLRHQVAINAMPLKDAFVVIFFLSVGMLFNPVVIVDHFWIFLATLGIILLVKPLAAFIIALCFKQSYKTALTVSLALAQIGEFSFILSEQAMKVNLFPEIGYDVIVACSLVSISLNAFLFRFLKTTSSGHSHSPG